MSLELLVPRDPDALLENAAVHVRFKRDEYLPYWATLWPAALLLADALAREPAPDERDRASVLELGCGLGLPGLVAAARGQRVVLSDYDPDALAFAAENARRNGLRARTCRLDWRTAARKRRRARVIAADVLYETRQLAPVAAFLAATLDERGSALLSDPGRGTADAFPAAARSAGLRVREAPASCTVVLSGDPLTIRGRLFRVDRP